MEDHIRGKNIRHKVRIRQYANTGVAFLEVKLRDVHSKTFKHRIVRNGPWDAPLNQEEVEFLGEHLPNAHALVPTLQSSFERFTLIHVGQGERITFDQDLQFKVPAANADEDNPWVKPTPHWPWWSGNRATSTTEANSFRPSAQKGRDVVPWGARCACPNLSWAKPILPRNETSEATALRCVTWRVLNITLQTRPSRRNRF